MKELIRPITRSSTTTRTGSEIGHRAFANDLAFHGLGGRIDRCYPCTTMRRSYAGAGLIEETDRGSTPTILRRFLYGNGIDEVPFMENATADTKYFDMDNALGAEVKRDGPLQEFVFYDNTYS